MSYGQIRQIQEVIVIEVSVRESTPESTSESTPDPPPTTGIPEWCWLVGLVIVAIGIYLAVCCTKGNCPWMTAVSSTDSPTNAPTYSPSYSPTYSPTHSPTNPTSPPTNEPSNFPTIEPTYIPSDIPSNSPIDPTHLPTNTPSYSPSISPTNSPTLPTYSPTNAPTNSPTPISIATASLSTASMYWILGFPGVIMLILLCCIMCLNTKLCEKLPRNTITNGFENATNDIQQFAEENYVKCKRVKDRVDNKLETHIKSTDSNKVAFNIKHYTSWIANQFPEASSLLILYAIVIFLLDTIAAFFIYVFKMEAGFATCSPCSYNLIITWTTITGVFLVLITIIHLRFYGLLYYGLFNILYTMVYLTLMLTQTTLPFSCIPHISSNTAYILILILLIVFITFTQIVGYNPNKAMNIIETESLDVQKKQELQNLSNKLTISSKQYPLSKLKHLPDHVSYWLQILALKYPFQVSLIVMYESAICLFKIRYDECLPCKDNEGEFVLRSILFGLFLLLGLYVEYKMNTNCDGKQENNVYDGDEHVFLQHSDPSDNNEYDSDVNSHHNEDLKEEEELIPQSKSKKSTYSIWKTLLINVLVLFCLMHLSSTKTISCWTNNQWIILGITLFCGLFILGILVREIRKSL
eukprot:319808_1